MEKRTFGRTGLEVSVLGFGGAPIGYLDTDQEQVIRIVNLLLDSGVNVIDTAASYPGSEEAIGKALGKRRDQVVLISKCGQSFDDLPGEPWSRDVILRTVDRSLQRLQTDRLDVMLLHSCGLEVLQKGEAIEALMAARDAGKVRFIGYSGDNEAAVFAAQHPELTVLETSISICDQANIRTVLPITLEREVGVIAKRPIANAAWKDLSQQRGLYASYAETYTRRFASMKVTVEDLGFEGPPAQVWPEIALRFTLSQPGVHTAIIGTTNPDHVRENLDYLEKGPLPELAIQKLRIAFESAETRAGEEWLGQT